jgi:translation initiation factor 2B subunit (eIF-2B alpha/beta/delta family)
LLSILPIPIWIFGNSLSLRLFAVVGDFVKIDEVKLYGLVKRLKLKRSSEQQFEVDVVDRWIELRNYFGDGHILNSILTKLPRELITMIVQDVGDNLLTDPKFLEAAAEQQKAKMRFVRVLLSDSKGS